MPIARRDLLLGAFASPLLAVPNPPKLKITGLELFVVKVNHRGNWIFLRLQSDKGVTGIGEASHGILDPRKDAPMAGVIKSFHALVEGESPFQIEQYRKRGWAKAKAGGRPGITGFSGIEQALWDMCGRALGIPVYDMLGGKLRDELNVYANINRATNDDRGPAGFAANAKLVVADGFKAVKGAPFDGVPPLTSSRAEINKEVNIGVKCVEAMREAIGLNVDLLIDCHSHFDVKMAIDVAKRLEPMRLYWYEEPVDPEQLEDTKAIASAIRQKLSGGEVFFGKDAFAKLTRSGALAVIMPDVKHCGGILEAHKIAAVAEVDGTLVSPHNPSGPVATAASVQICASIPNFSILEFAWGEASWRSEVITPPEQFRNGAIAVPATPGLGIELNERAIKAHS